jgi:glycerol kinase
MGAAYLAGLGTGFYKSTDEISTQWAIDRTFEPQMGADQRNKLRNEWSKAVLRAKAWANA